MTLSILFSALVGAVTGYPLMKLELKSVQREKVRRILDIVAQGMAATVCVLPFLLFKFPAAFVLVGLMAVAGLRKTYAAVILAFVLVYLLSGGSGLLLSIFCPGILVIPTAFIFLIVRSHSKVKEYTSLGIAESRKIPAQINDREIKPAPKYSLQLTALYVSLLVMVVEFGSLSVGAIQVSHKREKALPRLVQATRDDPYDALEALKEYGKEAAPFEIEMIHQQFQNGWDDTKPTYSGANFCIAELTSHILEMGEAEGLSQLGENQKKALRAAANQNTVPVIKIAIKELSRLNAIPELVSLLNSSDYQEVMEGILQLSPSETIPTIMEWEANDKRLIYAPGNFHSQKDENYCVEIAKYGAKAVPALTPYLGDENSKVKEFATQILLKIGQPTVPALKQMLVSKNNNEVTQAAYILGMLGDKSALPILIEKIKNRDRSLSEALSFISDDRATQCLIAEYEIEKSALAINQNSRNKESLETYELFIANTKTVSAQNFLEKVVRQTNSITHRKQLLDALCNDFWIGTRREKITAWIETIQNFSGAESQSAAVELQRIGDPVVLPFLIDADAREHEHGALIEGCKIHKAIAALSK